MQHTVPRPLSSRLLRQELLVSVGCTEPAALALAAAAASRAAGGEPRRLRVRADLGTYKNALAVGLPGTALRGPAAEAALGAVLADPDRGLAIFAAVDETAWRAAGELLATGVVEVSQRTARGVDVEARVEGAGGEGWARIAGRHDRLVEVTGPGVTIGRPAGAGSPEPAAGQEAVSPEEIPDGEISDEEIRRRLDSAEALLAALGELDDADLERVRRGIAMNRELAEGSLAVGSGWGLGSAFRDLDQAAAGALQSSVKAWVAAGVEARMAGVASQVTTSGGSGNSGITVALGVWAAARASGIDDEDRVARAAALGHLVNVAVKARIGRVGPLCGGAIASSMGVGCALAWLLGGDAAAVDRVIRHLVDTTAGTVCDGARRGCALKIASGLGVAIEAALLAVARGGRIGAAGLGGGDARQALRRLERLAGEAFAAVDPPLVAILTGEPGSELAN